MRLDVIVCCDLHFSEESGFLGRCTLGTNGVGIEALKQTMDALGESWARFTQQLIDLRLIFGLLLEYFTTGGDTLPGGFPHSLDIYQHIPLTIQRLSISQF